MSRKPQAQRREAVRNARADRKHWEGKLKNEPSKEGKQTFLRAIAKQNRIIKDNK